MKIQLNDLWRPQQGQRALVLRAAELVVKPAPRHGPHRSVTSSIAPVLWAEASSAVGEMMLLRVFANLRFWAGISNFLSTLHCTLAFPHSYIHVLSVIPKHAGWLCCGAETRK